MSQGILSETELDRLKNAKSESEWNAICDEVKRANGGAYPPDWFARVVLSGVAAAAQSGWNRADKPAARRN